MSRKPSPKYIYRVISPADTFNIPQELVLERKRKHGSRFITLSSPVDDPRAYGLEESSETDSEIAHIVRISWIDPIVINEFDEALLETLPEGEWD